MAEVTTTLIKELRETTGCGVMDAKRALDSSAGDLKKAAEIIRDQGMARAEKRSERETGQGIIESYLHGGGRIGVLVELNCETDFVANTPEFRQLAREVAMQIAAMNPLIISAEERTPEMEGSDAEIALMSQPFIKDSGRAIGDLVKDVIARTGENVRVRRFSRYELGR